jgi:hypothetical protein
MFVLKTNYAINERERERVEATSKKFRYSCGVPCFTLLFLVICVGLFLKPSLAHADITTGLVGHWTLNAADITNNISDTSGSGHTGYLHLGIGGSTATTTVPGPIKEGLSFDGVDDYIDIPSFNVSNITVSAWVWLDPSISAFRTIIAKYNGSDSSWILNEPDGNSFSFTVYIGGVTKSVGSLSIYGIGKWHHVVSTYDGSHVAMYVDGQSVGAPTAASGNIDSSLTDINIAARQGGSILLKGYENDVRIYNRALTTSDVTELYQLGYTPQVTTSAASGVTNTTSTLNGSIDVQGVMASSSVRGFSYGLSTAYGATTTENGKFGIGAFSASISNLSASTLYHFRAYASNATSTAYGNDQTFTTTGSADNTPPIPGSISFSNVTITSITATTTGTSDNIALASLPFLYHNVTDGTYLSPTSTAVTFTGLIPNTSYTFEVGVEDLAGNWATSTQQATTTLIGVAVPTVLTPTISSVTATSATASSSVTVTGGASVTAEGFAWGLDTTYSIGTTTIAGAPFGVNSFQNASTTLVCNTIYHVRAYAMNSTGIGYSSDQTFTTSVCNSVTITSPVAYRVFQRNSSNQASISISGTYTGSPASIEASWNGGSYSTIVASPSGGTFSGTLANQMGGQGILNVRFTNDTSVLATKNYIGVGDIFVVAGQSNADGYGLSLHTYSNPTLKASMVDNTNTWKELSDPTSQIGGASGSEWPLLATLFMADQNVPIAFIPTSQSGSRIAPVSSGCSPTDAYGYWARNNSNPQDASTLYGQMYARINNVGAVKAVLWWQGESEAADNCTYNFDITNYRILVNNIFSDFGVKTVVAQIGDRSSTNPVTALDHVRLAQHDLWNEGGNALPGPSLYDVTLTVDGVHFKTDAEQQIATNRWWAAIKQDFYGGTDGRGPILSTAQYTSDMTQIYLTFTSNVLPLLPASGYSGFTVKDNGSVVSISSITKVASNQLRINLASAASGPITVSLGQGRTGTGATVPTDSSAYNLPAEIFVDATTTALAATSYTFAGPPSGNVGNASTNFTVTPNGPYTGTITFTPTAGFGLSATTLTWSGDSSAKTFTITPTAAGSITLTATNSGTLTNASPLTYSSNATVPGQPTAVTAATSTPNQATISFTAPTFTGGSTILYYLASSTPGNFMGVSMGASSGSMVVSGLTNGTSYTFAVYAVNAIGTSTPSSASNAVTPIGLPGVPTGVTATAGNTQASVTFSAPGITGGSQITGYTVISNPSGGTDINSGQTALTHTVTGLVNGTPYTFTVTATNIVGTGSASSASSPVTPSTISAVSTNSTTNVASTTATLNGSIISTGGSNATEHGFAYGTVANLSTAATTTLGSQTGTGNFSSNVTGLISNTTYYVRAYAVNTAGTTTGSILSFLTLPAVPTLTTQAPTAGSGIFFTANGNITATGGVNATIRGFVYGTTLAYGATATESSSFGTGAYTASITGLTCNTLYHIASYATNTGGTGYGSDQTITTGVCTKPTVATSTPSGVTTVAATLNGSMTADGNASSTVEGFNWGNDTSYGQIASTNGTFGTGSFSQPLTGLACGTTYHYQVFATNVVGQGTSTDQSVTTLACPVTSTPTVTTSVSSSGGGSASSQVSNLIAMGNYTLAQQIAKQYGLTIPTQNISVNSPVSNFGSSFTRTLKVGVTNSDVKKLQIFLNAQGFTVAQKGAGSSGHETTYFGPATKAALMKFQLAHKKETLDPQGLKSPTGFFGVDTMKTVNKLMK